MHADPVLVLRGRPARTLTDRSLFGLGKTGDHHLFHPAGQRPENGLNASIRLEAIRDGLEDLEYLNMLGTGQIVRRPPEDYFHAPRLVNLRRKWLLLATIHDDAPERISGPVPVCGDEGGFHAHRLPRMYDALTAPTVLKAAVGGFKQTPVRNRYFRRPSTRNSVATRE